MKGRILCVVLFVAFVTIVMGMQPSEAKVIPRIANFIMIIDQSGSMFQGHIRRAKVKAALAKAVLLEMNERIPDLGYHCAVQVFSPKRMLVGPRQYDRAFLKGVFSGLVETGEVFQNLTPLGPAILDLDNTLDQFHGKTAVIILSDGRANQGMNPVEAAKKVYSEHDNVCFHVISFADNEKGRENLRAISELENCVFAVGGDLLADKGAMDRFISEVFYLEVEESVPGLEPVPPVEEVQEAEEAPDEKIVLDGANFDFDKYNIKPEWAVVLDQQVEKLRNHPELRIVVEGHTDNVGTEQYNQRLSERRAGAVYDYLLNRGISADRMETVGYGETWPKISNLTKEGRAINRRVELTVAD